MAAHEATSSPHEFPSLTIAGSWEDILQGPAKATLEQILPAYVTPRRWFGSKARVIEAAHIAEAMPIGDGGYLTLMQISYTEGAPEIYVLPLAFAAGQRAAQLAEHHRGGVVAHLKTGSADGVLYDAVWEPGFCQALLEAIGQQQQFHGATGDITAMATHVYAHLRGDPHTVLKPVVHGGEQSNTSIPYGDRLILKLFRRLETGTNPDLEIGAFLTENTSFANIPPVAGALEYRRGTGGEPITLALLQAFVPNQGDAWRYTLHALGQYFEQALAQTEVSADDLVVPDEPLLELAKRGAPAQATAVIGDYLDSARLLGRRTAELHLALASDAADPAFAPEPFTLAYQRALQQSMVTLVDQNLQQLRRHASHMHGATRASAQQVLDLEPTIRARFDTLTERPIAALRTRIHGDYHLGQVLYTGHDFMIIDFEGEPARPLSERRQKRSALQDVAGMLRSFHYAAYSAYFDQIAGEGVTPERSADLETWARFWHLWVSVAFLQTYLEAVADAAFMPRSPDDLKLLLDALLVEKAVYELGYELNNRPSWVRIPLQGILQTVR